MTLRDKLHLPFFGLAATSHIANIVGGAYKGAMDAAEMPVESNLFPILLGANVVTTTISHAMDKPYGKDTPILVLNGAALGLVLSPVEFTLGYIAGYVGGKILY